MTDSREIDRSPARMSAALAASAAALAAVATGLASTFGLGVAGPGFLVVLLGVLRGSRRAVTLGTAALLVGTLVSGLASPSVFLLLPAIIGTVLAYDFGEQAINVGEQLGREAETTRLEVMHAAGSTVVAVGAGGFAYAVYVAAAGGQPVTALVFLLIAAVVLTSALRN
ncbi:DUF7519 family protein [Halorussus halophilus]|uniref:DUF7519 family protein n=1 Tax=Halorussus halophilus TaxID=2650975 RepID=UPI001CE48FAF|nr:hypothetical protein [Halorussus halophilus]